MTNVSGSLIDFVADGADGALITTPSSPNRVAGVAE